MHFSGSVAADLARECCRGVYGSGISGGKYTRTFELFIDIISHLERGLTVESCSFASMQIWHYFADIIHFQQFSSHHEANPITSAIDFMTNHVEQNLTLEEICKEINLSPTYFCRAFKGKVGHTPIDYFIRMKIQRACQYLDLTELKVKEVSEKIGYDDPYYFSRLFKKIMAKSPSEYRETSHGLF